MNKSNSRRIRWLAAIAVAAAGFAALPAQAHTDLAIGVTLGAPAYYYAPPPRYYPPTVIYEEPVYYGPRVVYEHRYCPPPRVYYHRPHGRAYGYYREHERWDY